ncbi:NUDIX hydrolase [Litchfieldia alkalitelluris]|uniref:NUDIX hydrolase n=1 Tax=Litchfieldia alkalitelluris TaxID=304268 RepID=UPI0009961E23|nr:CoA pyrophosphatase [Litchfieldia alkalitelluris]
MKIEDVVSKFQNNKPVILGSSQFSQYSILLPLVETEKEIHVLFEVRSKSLRRQPGEICFPGGRIDQSDKSEKFTAIRETTEELGINQNQIKNVMPLDYIVSPFGMIIYPFIGVITNVNDLRPNQSEVEEIFTVPLSFFISNPPETYKINLRIEPEDDFPYESIIGGENYQWQLRSMKEHFYYYQDKVIWGLTARVLNHFIEKIKES